MVNILFMVDEIFTGEAKMVKKMMSAMLRFKKKLLQRYKNLLKSQGNNQKLQTCLI